MRFSSTFLLFSVSLIINRVHTFSAPQRIARFTSKSPFKTQLRPFPPKNANTADEVLPKSKRQRLISVAKKVLPVLLLPLLVGAHPAFATASYRSNPPSLAVLTAASPISMLVELQLVGRLFFAALAGGILGKERSGHANHHHPAGLRTLALVSLGAAAFTVCSVFGFAAAGRYDPSRMAANVASGVGFIGAGVITTQSLRGESVVHGLTTATAIWLAASIGVLSGVGCYILATATTLLTVGILRIGQVQASLSKVVHDERLIFRRRSHFNHTGILDGVQHFNETAFNHTSLQ